MGVGELLGLWVSRCSASVASGVFGVLGSSVTSGRSGASAKIVDCDMVMRADFGRGGCWKEGWAASEDMLVVCHWGLPGVLGACVAGLW